MDRALGLKGRIGLVVIAVLLASLPVEAAQVKLNVGLAHPVLLANKKQTTYLKVGLTGFPMTSMKKRTPVNVAIVLDKSGSMGGQKIERAKDAAIMAINRLNSDDIVSVIAYDSTVHIVVPATKVSDKTAIAAMIRQIYAGGSTALFAGVSKGAAEVRKFLDRNRVNRIILLSDGLANVGPSSPAELGALGSSLAKEGIAVTTFGLGLGYNEDLMVQLAGKSDGNHAFIESTEQLAKIFNYEFGDILTVVAQEVVVRIECTPGIRPVRVLGREADVTGRTVVGTLNQLYSNQEKYLLVEVEVPATPPGLASRVAKVTVSYANMQTQTTDHLSSAVAVRFGNSSEVVERETKTEVIVAAVEQIANENNRLAMALRDQGKIDDARHILRDNAAYLSRNVHKYKSKALISQQFITHETEKNLEKGKWERQRKAITKDYDTRARGQRY